MTEGLRVVVDELGEDPEDALARCLRVEPMARPDVATLGPRDVLVRVESAQVGWVDLIMASGQYQHAAAVPYTPGLEYAGTVEWRGAEAAARVSVGDEVLADGFLTGPRSAGAHQRWGGFATWAVAPVEAVMARPHGLSADEAASLLGSYETAYHCLIARGRLQAGETVLVHGASGATGLAAVHVAKLCGATVIATGRSPDKLAAVAREGADHVLAVDVTSEAGQQAMREQVRALTGGKGVEVVYDGVGGPISTASLRCVRFGARYLIVGWAATPGVARGKGGRGAPNANVLPTNLIMMKGLDVLGCPTVISTVERPAIRGERLAAILAWVEAGRLRPTVTRVWPLAEARDALRAKWRGEIVGAGVLRP
jgi:NADPH2:quinone reductase